MRRIDRTIPTVTALALLPFLLVVVAGCEDEPLSAEEGAVLSAPQDAVANGHRDRDEDDDDDDNGPRVPFDDAEVFFEFNTTDNDLGFQMFVDAEGWKRFRLAAPGQKEIVEITTDGALAELGITELRFESAEPSPAEVLALFPRGVYTFTGRTVEGARLASRARLSHRFLAAPTFSPSDGEEVDPAATVVTWHAPDARRVEIIIEDEESGDVFDVIVTGAVTSLDVPPQFLRPGTEYKIEVLAIAENGNRTIAESTFVTQD